MEKKVPQSKGDSQWGKGASDLTPDERTIDTKTGFILAASLPLALLAFWKVTLPLMCFTVSSVLGAERLQKINFLSQDVFSLMTSPCPPWISAEQRAFLANQSFQQVQRYNQLTQEKFHLLLDEGAPFIVTDAMPAWQPDEWSCLNFINRFPDAVFFDWQKHTEIQLEEVLSRSGYEGLECLSGELIIGEKDWKNRIPFPHFMGGETPADSGLWTGFIGVQGTGTPPHVDESCMTFMSVQIVGSNSWIVALVMGVRTEVHCGLFHSTLPLTTVFIGKAVVKASSAVKGYLTEQEGVTSWSFSRLMIEGDAVRWSRPLKCFLQPGEMIVWFPSMRFHTEVVDGCSLSFRYGFQVPSPNGYLKEVQSLLSSLSEKGERNLRSEVDPEELDMVERCSSHEEYGQTTVR